MHSYSSKGTVKMNHITNNHNNKNWSTARDKKSKTLSEDSGDGEGGEGEMKLNDPKKAELKRDNTCHNAKHAKLHSDLVQAPKWAP